VDERPITTTVRLSKRAWALLRDLAHARAIAQGGRTSASAVLEELVLAASDRKAATVEPGR